MRYLQPTHRTHSEQLPSLHSSNSAYLPSQSTALSTKSNSLPTPNIKMQFTTQTLIIMATAILSVNAAPAPNNGGGSSGSSCPVNTSEVCCVSTGIVSLGCVLSSVLGQTCNSQVVCCTNNGQDQTCVDSSGTSVSVPITVPITVL